ncbi:MAG: cupin domain-containing protein [Bacteroidales bacterium]|nr:cupin domain-containing protein [Bacteroidales bacterium]
MKIDFSKIDLETIPAFKGGEKEYRVRTHLDDHNRIMKGCLVPGASIGVHSHQGTSEVIYILSGHGHALYNGEREDLGPGDCHYCEENATHTLINSGTEDLVFIAVVPQHHLG